MFKRNSDDDHVFLLTGSFGSVKVREMILDHCSIISFHGHILEPGMDVAITRSREFLGLCFNLQEDHPSEIGKHQFNMMYMPDVAYRHHLQKGTCSVLYLVFKPAYLKIWAQEFPIIDSLLAKAQCGIPAKISKMNLPVTPEVLGLIRDVLHTTYTGIEKETFIRARIVDILKGCLDQFTADAELLRIVLLPEDIKKIIKARDYLLQHLKNPFPVSLIAGKMELDETTLTKGFRLLFGMSLQYFLLEERMKRAKVLLLDTDIQISKIAAELGYKTLAHFSGAFRRRFGHAPRDLRLGGAAGDGTPGHPDKK